MKNSSKLKQGNQTETQKTLLSSYWSQKQQQQQTSKSLIYIQERLQPSLAT